MFSHDFLEGSAESVDFPGVTRKALECVQYYLYTDQAPLVPPSTCLPVIELANRLVLPRLITVLEHAVITAMREVIEDGGDVFQAALDLVEASHVHNAPQLYNWCMVYLAQNYTTLTTSFQDIFKTLSPDTQTAIKMHQWPPSWFVADYELYSMLSACSSHSIKGRSRKRQRPNSVCLCFSSQQGQTSSYNLAGLAMGEEERRRGRGSKRSCSSSAITQTRKL